MDEHLINDLRIMPTPGNAARYVKVVRNEDNSAKTIENTGSYIDDPTTVGAVAFKKSPIVHYPSSTISRVYTTTSTFTACRYGLKWTACTPWTSGNISILYHSYRGVRHLQSSATRAHCLPGYYTPSLILLATQIARHKLQIKPMAETR